MKRRVNSKKKTAVLYHDHGGELFRIFYDISIEFCNCNARDYPLGALLPLDSTLLFLLLGLQAAARPKRLHMITSIRTKMMTALVVDQSCLHILSATSKQGIQHVLLRNAWPFESIQDPSPTVDDDKLHDGIAESNVREAVDLHHCFFDGGVDIGAELLPLLLDYVDDSVAKEG